MWIGRRGFVFFSKCLLMTLTERQRAEPEAFTSTRFCPNYELLIFFLFFNKMCLELLLLLLFLRQYLSSVDFFASGRDILEF